MGRIQRKDFYFTCHDALTGQGIWLAELVEKLAHQTGPVIEGASFQIGWSILRLVKKSGALALCEPDFDTDPFVHCRDDISATLTVIAQQHAVLSTTGCTPVDIRFDDKIILFKDCLSESRLYGERLEPTKGDSGWYIGPAREHDRAGPDDLEAIWAFELLHRRPHLLAALCLPAGWLVFWNGTDIEEIVDENNEAVSR